MTTPAIRITFDSPTAHYQPGDRLSGRFIVEGTQLRTIRAVELSVLWYTAGKGEEDMAVHHFERLVDDHARPLDLRVPRRSPPSAAEPAQLRRRNRESLLVRSRPRSSAARPGN